MLGAKGKAGADHVLIGRDGGIERDFAELRADMARALDKLGK
jgi:ribonuclease P protein component